MTAIPPPGEAIDYPSSDGLPMGETDIHRDEMASAIFVLADRFRGQNDVYVAGNLLVYYEEGNPKARFSPDVFVIRGVPNRQRRVYKLWEEQQAPGFVLEVSSRGTWLEDFGNKKALCARLGVAEYFLYDPEADYLHPSLQGFRLDGGEYRHIRPGSGGGLRSKALGLILRLDGLRLRFFDAQTGARLPRPEELARAIEASDRARVEADRARAEADRARAEAEARLAAAEAELEKLRRRS